GLARARSPPPRPLRPRPDQCGRSEDPTDVRCGLRGDRRSYRPAPWYRPPSVSPPCHCSETCNGPAAVACKSPTVCGCAGRSLEEDDMAAKRALLLINPKSRSGAEAGDLAKQALSAAGILVAQPHDDAPGSYADAIRSRRG